jgi:hypothetical protein
MTRARWRALGLLLTVGLAAVVLAAFWLSRGPAPLPARAPAERPRLLLLTSLPLLFGEDFSLSAGSPALDALSARYRVVPISTTAPAELARGRLLLMAQPLAQTAENLVALDDWVRRGGRVLLLADPRLEWPSRRPPGDPLRPPPMFMDTGLLAHWGLRLDTPDQPGSARRKLGGYAIMTLSPGTLYGGCAIAADRLAAECRVGPGHAIVIADADFLDVRRLNAAENNLDGLLEELARLEHP